MIASSSGNHRFGSLFQGPPFLSCGTPRVPSIDSRSQGCIDRPYQEPPLTGLPKGCDQKSEGNDLGAWSGQVRNSYQLGNTCIYIYINMYVGNNR